MYNINTEGCLYCLHIKQTHGTGFCLDHKNKIIKCRVYARIQMKKWRTDNVEHALKLGRRHQTTWRNKHPELNRLRARLGKRKQKERLNGSRITGIY